MAKCEKTRSVSLHLTMDEAEAVLAVLSICGDDAWTGGVFDALYDALCDSGENYTAKWDEKTRSVLVTR